MQITFEEFAYLRRRAAVAKVSLLSSLTGYLVSSLLLTVAAILEPHGDQILPLWFEVSLSLVFTLAGWLIVLLPLSWNYRSGAWLDSAWVAGALGALIGTALIAPIGVPMLHGIGSGPRTGILYLASAFANAATASIVCVSLMRSSEVRSRVIYERFASRDEPQAQVR